VCFDVLLFVLPIRLAFLAESARTRLNDEVRSTGSRRACPDVAIVRGAKGICPQLRFHTRPKRSLGICQPEIFATNCASPAER